MRIRHDRDWSVRSARCKVKREASLRGVAHTTQGPLQSGGSLLMAAIVLVHGIAQQQFSADSLEKDWLPALAGGVRTAGYPEVADRIWRGQAGPEAIEAR